MHFFYPYGMLQNLSIQDFHVFSCLIYCSAMYWDVATHLTACRPTDPHKTSSTNNYIYTCMLRVAVDRRDYWRYKRQYATSVRQYTEGVWGIDGVHGICLNTTTISRAESASIFTCRYPTSTSATYVNMLQPWTMRSRTGQSKSHST